jgi:hypothetical protein
VELSEWLTKVVAYHVSKEKVLAALVIGISRVLMDLRLDLT